MDTIDQETINSKITDLRSQINHHRFCYYILESPQISDLEFDNLFNQLKALESQYPDLITSDSPTQSVGYNPSTDFKQIKHLRSMLSLDNATSIADIANFINKIDKNLDSKDDKLEYLTELKIDGLSLSLRYEKGQLVQGVTRGNGEYGEDITLNVRTIKTIPKTIPQLPQISDSIEVRGEVFMPVSAFNALNEALAQNGEKTFANARNASSGSLRQKDPKLTAKRNLSFFAYFLFDNQDNALSIDQSSQLELLQSMGFMVEPNHKLCQSLSEIENFCNTWEFRRHELDYLTDGLVIKLNNSKLWDVLGNTSHSPRWAIAYKFKPMQASTILESVDFEVGRTGVVTPVANLKPVTLAGSVIKRATLHNIDQINRLDIRVGDMVVIEKAGEVIPAIVRVEISDSHNQLPQIEYPKFCPACQTALEQVDNDVAYRCVNYNACPSQNLRRLEHFASKDAMEIDGLGPAIIKKLFDSKIVLNPADIYKIDESKLLEVDRMGKKLAANILTSIVKSKQRCLSNLLYALGIRHIGQNSAQLLAREFKNIKNILNANLVDFENIDGIGPILAKSVYDYFQDSVNISIVQELINLGINSSYIEVDLKRSDILQNASFVITGELVSFTRAKAHGLIVENGGIVNQSVTSKLDYLVVGEKPGSKLQKAEKLGVKIIDETKFKELLKYSD